MSNATAYGGTHLLHGDIATEFLVSAPARDARKDDIWHILELTEKDFVPPLPEREPTLTRLKPSRIQFPLPIQHFDFYLGLPMIMAYEGSNAVGFMSFCPEFEHRDGDETLSCILIDTVTVVPQARRHGIASALYATLFQSPYFEHTENAVLRDWSTNQAHRHLVERLGFHVIDRIPDERAPGIDTLIYLRHQARRPETQYATADV